MSAPWKIKKSAQGLYQFDFAVTVIIISILAVMVLKSLDKLEHHIEEVIQETVLNHIRLGLTEYWLHQNVTHQTIDMKTLLNSNPMHYVAEKPENYVGEMPSRPGNSKEIWYFDTGKKELIYVYNDGRQAHYRLESLQAGGTSALLSAGSLAIVAVKTE